MSWAPRTVCLENGTRYDVRVRATNEFGQGPWATSLYGVTDRDDIRQGRPGVTPPPEPRSAP